MTRRRSSRRRGKNGRYTAAAPGIKPGKRSVSVSAATFARVKERAGDGGDAMAWVLDDALAPVFAMSPQQQAALVERIRGERTTVTTVAAVRRPARRPVVADPPIPFWLLPTGPTRK